MFPLKKMQSYVSTMASHSGERDVMSDMRYIRKSCSLITEALQKGCDVMHMPNGDIIITEVKTFTFQYSWDEKKGKMVRVQSGGRQKKAKSDKLEDEQEEETELETV
jgi:hypothetical protein